MASITLEVLQPGTRADYILEHAPATRALGLPLRGAPLPEGLYSWDDEAATLESVQAQLDRIDPDWRDVFRVLGPVR